MSGCWGRRSCCAGPLISSGAVDPDAWPINFNKAVAMADEDLELELNRLEQELEPFNAEEAELGVPAPGVPYLSPPPAEKPTATPSRQHEPFVKEPWHWEDNAESKQRLQQLFTVIDRFDAIEVGVSCGGASSVELMHMLVCPPPAVSSRVVVSSVSGSSFSISQYW